MPPAQRLKVFLTAPNIHPTATGEEFSAWKWAEALSELVDLTVFAFQRDNRQPLGETLPNARVITTPMPRVFARFPRFEAMAKPTYPIYMAKAKKALRESGPYDIAHQIMPLAARYPCPLRGQGMPYVIGPLGGALKTPDAFRNEGRAAAWYTRLRGIDAWRFRHDPWLRASYSEAELVIGVAPYMQDVLGDIAIKRFVPMLEIGIEDLAPLPPSTPRNDGTFRLLHVGRGVRTKGLRDVIRAMGLLKDDVPGLRLVSAGTGEDLEACRAEVHELGIADRVDFVGHIDRDAVEALYQEADVFAFPSYREPAGNVLYEAMRWGLPIIGAARGGPDWIIDEKTGIRVDVTEPQTFARDIAEAIRTLANDPERARAMGAAARDKLERTARWPTKAAALVTEYEAICQTRSSA